MKPSDTFEGRGGKRISYADYYKNRYNLTIRDLGQPMIISKPKLADQRRGFTPGTRTMSWVKPLL